MKTTYFFPLFFLMIFVLSSKVFAHGSIDEEWTIPPPVDGIHLVVDTMPEFPGGQQAMMRFIAENMCFRWTDFGNIQGRVTVQFTVLKTGEITDIAVVRGVDPLLDREAVRIVQSMPNWIPGKQRGEKVNVRFTLPIAFRLHC